MGHTSKEKKTVLLKTLVCQYADYLQTAKPLSRTTCQNYLCRVRRYADYLTETTDGQLKDLTKQSLLRWVNRVASHSPHAIRMHYSALRHFCRYLVAEEWLRVSPADGIPLPKVPRARRDTVPDDVVSALMDAIARLPVPVYRQALIRAALSLMVYGGMRISEALFVRLGDVRLDTGEIFVTKGKGSKSRPVYLPKEGIEAVRALLRLRPDCQHDFLLAHNTRYGMRWHGLRSALRDLHTVAGIAEHYTPHQLRHAYATRLLRNGASIADISAALGHTRIETTAIYLHSNTDRLQAIAHLASLQSAPSPARQTETASPPAKEVKRFRVSRLR